MSEPDIHGGTPSRPLSEAQRWVLDTIIKAIETRGYPPSVQEIATAAYLGKATVIYHLERLQRLGWIQRVPGQARAIRVLVQPEPQGAGEALSGQ